jgi:hypothetical protein
MSSFAKLHPTSGQPIAECGFRIESVTASEGINLCVFALPRFYQARYYILTQGRAEAGESAMRRGERVIYSSSRIRAFPNGFNQTIT